MYPQLSVPTRRPPFVQLPTPFTLHFFKLFINFTIHICVRLQAVVQVFTCQVNTRVVTWLKYFVHLSQPVEHVVQLYKALLMPNMAGSVGQLSIYWLMARLVCGIRCSCVTAVLQLCNCDCFLTGVQCVNNSQVIPNFLLYKQLLAVQCHGSSNVLYVFMLWTSCHEQPL